MWLNELLWWWWCWCCCWLGEFLFKLLWCLSSWYGCLFKNGCDRDAKPPNGDDVDVDDDGFNCCTGGKNVDALAVVSGKLLFAIDLGCTGKSLNGGCFLDEDINGENDGWIRLWFGILFGVTERELLCCDWWNCCCCCIDRFLCCWCLIIMWAISTWAAHHFPFRLVLLLLLLDAFNVLFLLVLFIILGGGRPPGLALINVGWIGELTLFDKGRLALEGNDCCGGNKEFVLNGENDGSGKCDCVFGLECFEDDDDELFTLLLDEKELLWL